MSKSRRLGTVMVLGAIVMLLLVTLVPAVSAQPGPGDDDEVRAPVTRKYTKPVDQPNIEAMKKLQKREEMLRSGKTAEASSLAVTGKDKVLALLVEYGGPDVATWKPGDTWDPYGDPVATPYDPEGDRCANVITQTTTFTYTGPLHNEIRKAHSTTDPLYGDVWTQDFSREWYERMLFGDGIVISYTTDAGDPVHFDFTGLSFRDFYKNQSHGLYDVEGDVVGWLKLPHSSAWYNADQCPGARSAGGSAFARYNGQMPGGGTSITMLQDSIAAVNAAYPGFDWSKYDLNGDGVLENVWLIYAGVSEADSETKVASEQYGVDQYGRPVLGEMSEWPHSGGVNVDVGDGVHKIDHVIVMPEADGPSVFAHEFGHRLGADDYYSYNYGETSAGYWTQMAADYGWFPYRSHPTGFDPYNKELWGWLDPYKELKLEDGLDQVVTLYQAQEAQPPDGTYRAVKIDMPEGELPLPVQPEFGDWYWFGGTANLLNSRMVTKQPIDLTNATSAELSFMINYDTEPEWDFFFTQVSTDTGQTWTSLENNLTQFTHDPQWIGDINNADLPGISGASDGWVEAKFDLSAYKGQKVLLRFWYMTDWGTLGAGVFVDNIKVTVDGGVVLSDGAEDAAASDAQWTYEEKWIRSAGQVPFTHRYYVEWRNTRPNGGFDAGLGTVPSLWGPADPGMLIWYKNDFYPTNEIIENLADKPAFGPKGKLLVVDAHPQPDRDPNWQSPYRAGFPDEDFNISSQSSWRDETFSLKPTMPWTTTRLEWWKVIVEATRGFTWPGRPPVSEFHDGLGYYPGLERGKDDGSGRRIYWGTVDWDASVVVPAREPYGIGPKWYDGSRIVQFVDEGSRDRPVGWYIAANDGQMVGSGNPLEKAFGLNIKILEQAADNSWARVRIYKSVPKVVTLQPGLADVGYVDSLNRMGSYFGSGYMWTGLDTMGQTPRTMHGVFQVDLSQIPAGSTILDAEVEIMGKSAKYMSTNGHGEWSLNLLDSSVDSQWRRLGYYQIHNAPRVATVRPIKLEPKVTDSDLQAGTWNRFTFEADQLAALQARLDSTGRASFRLDSAIAFSTASYGRHLFGWDGGAHAPVVRITYVAP